MSAHQSSRTLASFKGALMAMPAFYLLHLIRFKVFVPTNVLEVYTGILMLIWCYGMWKLGFPRLQLVKNRRWMAVALLLVVITLSTKLTGTQEAWGIWKGWFMAPFVYFLMLVSTFRTEHDLQKLVEAAVGFMGISAALMVWQYVVGSFGELQSTYDQRLVWPFVNFETGEPLSANYVALLLSPFLFLSLSLLLKAKNRVDQGFSFLAALALGVALFFTKSYGAWAALLGTLFVSVSFLWNTKKWMKIAIPVLLIAVGGLLYSTQKDSLKFAFFYENSIGERLKIWEVSTDMISQSPVLGIGPGAFQQEYAEQFEKTFDRLPTEAEVGNALHPHNIFLMFWASSGVFAFLSFVFLWGVFLIDTPKKWRWLVLPPMIYLFLHGLIDVFYWKNDLAYQFWLLLALIQIALQQRSVRGVIKHGIKKGRELGFPTANIELDIELDKDYGVYIVALKIEKIKKRGLLYYGPRKTKGLPENIVCEITIFDFDEDVYEKNIEFTIGKFIREPMEFDDPELLKKQIEKDVLIAKNIKA